MSRHKWNISLKNLPKKDSNKGGGIAVCLNCGCVLEYVKGVPTYFIDDTLHDRKTPTCDKRLLPKTYKA